MKRTRIKVANPTRRAKATTRNFGAGGRRGEAVRAMTCLVAVAFFASGMSEQEAAEAGWRGCQGDVQAAHASSRSMGGCGNAGGEGNASKLVPLCFVHHPEAGEQRGSARVKFRQKYGVDLAKEAARIATELDERGL